MTNESLSEDNQLFLDEFYSMINKIQKKKQVEKKAKINFSSLFRIAEFLVVAKPQSHTKIHKENLLKYLRELISSINDNNYSKTDYLFLKGNILYPITQWMRKYGFRTTYEIMNFKIYFGIIVDGLIWFLFYREYFYFVPILTFILILIGLKNLRELEKEKKLMKL